MPNDKVFAQTQKHRVFNGSNAADMLAAIQSIYPAATITASANYPGLTATVQILTDIPDNGGYPANFAVGDSWSFTTGGMCPAATLADSQLFVDLESYVASAVAAAVPTPALAVGYAVTPNLIVGASATVSVPMVPPLPDAGYNVAVALSGSAQLLGALQILNVSVVSASAVDVVVKNNGLLTLGGATVLVTALHNG